jgi:hypothetical protein
VGAERVALGSHVHIDEGVFIFAGQGVVIGHYVHLVVGSSISGFYFRRPYGGEHRFAATLLEF